MKHLLTLTVFALLISSFGFAGEVETDVESMQCNERTVINKDVKKQGTLVTPTSATGSVRK